MDGAPAAATQAPPPPPSGVWGATKAAVGHVWDKTSYGLNFEWLNLGKRTSAISLSVLLVALVVMVAATSGTLVKDNVTLGVEFGGGYSIL